jgi:acetyl esterase/lipase
VRFLRGLAVVVLLAACSGGPAAPSNPPSGAAVLTSDLFLPSARSGSVPVVVLVPGGGWTSADRSGLRPLAEALAASGLAVVSTTYRTASQDAFFPVPVEDVVCAVDDAVTRVTAAGVATGPVVVVGHSAGAQLAALAALVGDRYQDGCPRPARTIDALVGLAGPYDVALIPDVAVALFGVPPSKDPQAWRDGNPLTWAAQRPKLPVLLLHGDLDTTVPLSFSRAFATALRDGGHPVTLTEVAGADHSSIYRPELSAAPIAAFVRTVR